MFLVEKVEIREFFKTEAKVFNDYKQAFEYFNSLIGKDLIINLTSDFNYDCGKIYWKDVIELYGQEDFYLYNKEGESPTIAPLSEKVFSEKTKSEMVLQFGPTFYLIKDIE